MKAKMVVLVVLLVLLASAQAAQGSGGAQGVVTGPLHWTRFSACEHPQHPGLFLNFYVTDGCGHEVFLYGNLSTPMAGSTIWAEGTLYQGNGCTVLDITSFSLCHKPDPTE